MPATKESHSDPAPPSDSTSAAASSAAPVKSGMVGSSASAARALGALERALASGQESGIVREDEPHLGAFEQAPRIGRRSGACSVRETARVGDHRSRGSHFATQAVQRGPHARVGADQPDRDGFVRRVCEGRHEEFVSAGVRRERILVVADVAQRFSEVHLRVTFERAQVDASREGVGERTRRCGSFAQSGARLVQQVARAQELAEIGQRIDELTSQLGAARKRKIERAQLRQAGPAVVQRFDLFAGGFAARREIAQRERGARTGEHRVRMRECVLPREVER